VEQSDDPEKAKIGRQSLYYYAQSLYLQALSGWSLIFLRRSRQVSPLTYLGVSAGFLVGTYLTDYYAHPNLKHALWVLYNVGFGAALGAYFFQQDFRLLIDALYLIANVMTFFAACTYYDRSNNEGVYLTALLCSVFGVSYGLGVLRLFRWGLRTNDLRLYAVVAGALAFLMPWAVHRSVVIQDEVSKEEYNPINASLSYQWKQIP